MSKTTSTALLAAIQSRVANFATLVTIRRQDGRILRLTSSDTDITFNGAVYTNAVRFTLSASAHSSDFSVDNIDLTLSANALVPRADIQAGILNHAEVTIALVNRESPSDGQMIMNRGWVGAYDLNTLNVVKLTIVGLLKVLDFEIGRIYSPTCDADLGDRRCKFALNREQAYSPRNRYYQGEWFYVYDESVMDAATVTNPSFETGSPLGANDAIPGWTKSEGGKFITGIAFAADGTYGLSGHTTTITRGEQSIYQDLTIGTHTTVTTTEVDAGQAMLYVAAALKRTSASTFPRLFIEVLDATGNVIDFRDTRYVSPEVIDDYQDYFHVFPLIEGARTVRINLMMYKTSGAAFDAEFDDVRVFTWNRILQNPTNSLVHKVTRVSVFADADAYYPTNFSFETNDAEVTASATVDDVEEWLKAAGSHFGVSENVYGLFPYSGDYFLYAGDDLSGVQKTYSITSTVVDLVDDIGVSADKITSGVYVVKAEAAIGHGDADSAGAVYLDWLNDSLSVISTLTVSAPLTGTPTEWTLVTAAQTPPSTATKFRFRLEATSPAAASLASVGFDFTRLFIIDTSLPTKADPTFGMGDASYVFDQSATGIKNVSGALITRARTDKAYFDSVASADGRTFIATLMSGADGTYDTGLVRWVTGQNAGMSNVIRSWDSGTKGVTLYFEPIFGVEAGDVFEYHTVCHRRFLEDCVTVFDNGVNFRGFPYLPGTTSFGVTG